MALENALSVYFQEGLFHLAKRLSLTNFKQVLLLRLKTGTIFLLLN